MDKAAILKVAADLKADLDGIMKPYTEAIQECLDLLDALKRGTCWCEVGIGNPMLQTHTVTCVRVQSIMKRAGRLDA